jgi:aspartate/methionine/tyrosine aminotransferase
VLEIDPVFSKVEASATLAINERARALRAAGETVWHFGFGESPFPVPAPMQAALRDAAGEKGYLPSEGLPELRQAAADFLRRQWGCEFRPEQIVVGPGSKELIFDLLAILPGSVLVPVPAWVSYGPQAQLLRRRFVPIPTSREAGYRLDPASLQSACRANPGQKVLILNNPVNPTGTVYGEDDLRRIAEICRAEDVVVIADEIYGLVNFGLVDRVSLAAILPERTIITTGLSKVFAAGGWRLGIAAIPAAFDALRAPLRAMISETFSAVSAPVQYGAIPAFEFGEQIRAHVETATAIHAAASSYVHERLINAGLTCPRGEGAFYLFPDFDNQREALARRGVTTGAGLASSLLEDGRVATLPAGAFFLPESHLGLRLAVVDFNGSRAFEVFPQETDPHTLFPNLVAGCDALQRYVEGLAS